MKYFTKLDQYKASNVLIDSSRDAYSYGWWKFYDAKTGVFNRTFYSMSTVKHQHKALAILNNLNMPIKLVLHNTKANLTDVTEAVSDELDELNGQKCAIQMKIDKLKSQGPRYSNYLNQLNILEERIKEIETFYDALKLINER